MSKSYRSQLVGCFGNPVDENPTGVMEEAAFREKGWTSDTLQFW